MTGHEEHKSTVDIQTRWALRALCRVNGEGSLVLISYPPHRIPVDAAQISPSSPNAAEVDTREYALLPYG